MYNDFDKVLKSFEIGGENKPPTWGPWSRENVQKRRARRAKRKIESAIRKSWSGNQNLKRLRTGRF